MCVDSLLNRRYLQVSWLVISQEGRYGSVRVIVIGLGLGIGLGLALGLQLGIGIQDLGVTIAGRLYLRLGVTIASANKIFKYAYGSIC